ncbi:MAG: QueT transporter family protein [Ignisphaera sp.]|nr:QueT transporter family protein [Ignisphaera sp.]MDW8084800.1 QueT transporter family protein [Ignisphaera sp.]
MKVAIVRGIVIAAVYISLVVLLHPLSFGPIQIRVADMLSPLPYIMGIESVLALTLGTAVANIFSPFGIWDIVIGTVCTLTYSIINYIIGKLFGYRRWLLPIVAVVDSIIVGLYIGVVLLGYIFEAGQPHMLFLLVLLGNLAATIPGALIVIPAIRRVVYK